MSIIIDKTDIRFEEVNLNDIILVDNNPRLIADEDLKKLCLDIKNDLDLLKQRPPLLNHITSTNQLICYAGNQRVKAAIELGYKKLWCWIQPDVPEDIQNARMLKDNLHRGEWDPVFIDLIIKRWESFTGGKAVKIQTNGKEEA